MERYKSTVRFFGKDGKKYAYHITDGDLVACRRSSKLYVQKACESGLYEGGYILIRLPSALELMDDIEVEQWAFATLEKEGLYFAKIWRSDLDTLKRMELGQEKAEAQK